VKTDRPYLAVRAIIPDGTGKILILKRAGESCCSGEWCLPGGSIEYGQTAVDAVLREIEEETSLICHDVRFMFYSDSLPDQDLTKHYVNLFFLCHTSGQVILNHESSDYAWIGPDDLQKFKLAFNNKAGIMNFWQMAK